VADHARTSDPVSSDETVKSIVADVGYAELVMTAARGLGPGVQFDDTDLWRMIEAMTDRRHQRNVIARARGRLERDGHIVRVGIRYRLDRRSMHFALPTTTDPTPGSDHAE
jgi:hypothetical protein